MDRLLLIFTLALLLATPLQTVSFAQEKGEFRALWVTRFEWPNRDMNTCKGRIVRIFDNAAKANFNAILFQVRGQADTLYPSPIEPWSPILGSANPGWDPLEFAIQEARQRGMELHAYINPIPVWQKEGSKPPDTSPQHLFNLHSGADSNWVMSDAQGKPLYAEYYWFSPGVPQVSEHVRKVVVDLAKRYELDGIHLDRIRYPNAADHNPISKERFNGLGNPKKLPLNKWKEEQINRIVKHISAVAWSVKPELKMSASVWGIYDKTLIPGYGGFSSGIHYYAQDSIAWLRQGIIDAIVPMIYWDLVGSKPDYDECLEIFLKDKYGRHVYGGMHGKFEPPELKAEIEITRKLGAEGNIVFSNTSMSRAGDTKWDYFGKEIYPTKVQTPGMSWKKNPTEGILTGQVVKEKTGKPIVDALVTVEGVDGYELSSSDGFYAIFKLKPGTYTIVAKRGGAEAKVEKVEIKPGGITTADLKM